MKQEKQKYIDDHRLAYEAEVAVNWCPALGTVLANEEVVGGVSERGGHPVIPQADAAVDAANYKICRETCWMTWLKSIGLNR